MFGTVRTFQFHVMQVLNALGAADNGTCLFRDIVIEYCVCLAWAPRDVLGWGRRALLPPGLQAAGTGQLVARSQLCPARSPRSYF